MLLTWYRVYVLYSPSPRFRFVPFRRVFRDLPLRPRPPPLETPFLSDIIVEVHEKGNVQG